MTEGKKAPPGAPHLRRTQRAPHALFQVWQFVHVWGLPDPGPPLGRPHDQPDGQAGEDERDPELPAWH